MTRRLLCLVAVAFLGSLLPGSADARRSHLRVLRCNIDGTYTCGGPCGTLRVCCSMGGLI